MNKEKLKAKFNEAYRDMINNLSLSYPEYSYIFQNIFFYMWNDFPQYINLRTGDLYSPDFKKNLDQSQGKYENGEEKIFEKYSDILSNNTYNRCKKYLEDNDITFLEYRYEAGNVIICENEIALMNEYNNLYVYKTGDMKLPDWIKENLVFRDKENTSYDYLIFDAEAGAFTTMSLNVNNRDVDLNLNYNDDLPHNEIKNFLESEDSGIVILHGDPGTGKSTYIRHLINEIDNKFVYLDQSSFSSITDASFIKTLIRFENNVLILEDCEKLLIERDDMNSDNVSLAALLNLTDGLLGDSFKFKVICTFNTDLQKIDKALTRKGRLKVRYFFDKLKPEKTESLAKNLELEGDFKKPMHLADIYNFKDKVEYNKGKEKKTIGF